MEQKKAPPHKKGFFSSLSLDRIGIANTLFCAVHCAVFPLLTQVLPFLGSEFWSSKWIEYGILVITGAVGITSLVHSFRKHHHNILPLAQLLIGFSFLIINELVVENIWLLITAMIFIVLAHYLNIRLSTKFTHSIISI